MNNFLKNLHVMGYVSSYIFTNIIQPIFSKLPNTKESRHLYYTISPNCVLIANTNLNMFTAEASNVSIPYLIFINTLEQCIIHGYNSNTLLSYVIESINVSSIIEFNCINDEISFYFDLSKNSISNKSDNNCYLLELACIIPFVVVESELLDELIIVSQLITDNHIKRLVFICLGHLLLYVSKSKTDSLYDSSNWINRLTDMLFDNKFIQKITGIIDIVDLRKFTFMLVKFNDKIINLTEYQHDVMQDIADCFLISIENLPINLPGYSSDQLLLLVIQILIYSKQWNELITRSLLTYSNIKHISLLTSILYFYNNLSDTMHSHFDVANMFIDQHNFISLLFNNKKIK